MAHWDALRPQLINVEDQDRVGRTTNTFEKDNLYVANRYRYVAWQD